MCDCIHLNANLISPVVGSIDADIFVAGQYNGFNYYEFEISGTTFYLAYEPSSSEWICWINGLGFGAGGSITTIFKNTTGDCVPTGSFPSDWVTSGTYWSDFTTTACQNQIGDCQCGVNLTISGEGTGTQVVTASVIGIANTRLLFRFYWQSGFWIIRWNPSITSWEILFETTESLFATLPFDLLCPIGTLDDWQTILTFELFTEKNDCAECGFEDRTKRDVKSIKLPSNFVEQNRGFRDCCCEWLVLAGNGNESWKNDVSSAWIKISDDLDTFNFRLYKNDVDTGFECVVNEFPNDENAFYTTIEWSQIINLFGVGCYEIRIDYEISNISDSIVWGKYVLDFYTIQNALKTARVKARFNGFHQTDGINFRGSNIVDTFRFYGYIGNRQPNTEIDNLIYENREMKRVIRENLNSYEIITDPSNECIIKPLMDLYLLSENELFISDYNAHNHSYRILDLPVIVAESPVVEYYDFSRKAKLKCIVNDKFKTNRTYY